MSKEPGSTKDYIGDSVYAEWDGCGITLTHTNTTRMRKSKKRPIDTPIMPERCATCPFREGSKTAFLRQHLTESALFEASRICHSTGSNNAFHRRTGKPEHLCRGARDEQLQFFHRIGVIDAPTDEAWEAKCRELGLRKTV